MNIIWTLFVFERQLGHRVNLESRLLVKNRDDERARARHNFIDSVEVNAKREEGDRMREIV
jgi:hypothetical protein